MHNDDDFLFFDKRGQPQQLPFTVVLIVSVMPIIALILYWGFCAHRLHHPNQRLS